MVASEKEVCLGLLVVGLHAEREIVSRGGAHDLQQGHTRADECLLAVCVLNRETEAWEEVVLVLERAQVGINYLNDDVTQIRETVKTNPSEKDQH